MADPILRIRASGYGGSGYAIPTRTDTAEPRTDKKQKMLKVPGVTTVLGALDKPGIVQWAVDNTAAYAVANADTLADRDEDWGFKYLRFYHHRKPDYDDPEVNIHNYHEGVLNDLANTGTIIHEAIESYVNDDVFGAPTFTKQGQVDAFERFLDWVDENDVVFEQCETTVLNPELGYAGTLDLVIVKDGKRYLVDTKSSRYPLSKKTGRVLIHTSHISQVASLAQAKVAIRPTAEVDGREHTIHKDLYWEEFDMPEYDGYAVLQVRPTSVDDYGNEIPAFCEFHEIDKRLMEPAFQQFKGALLARQGEYALKQVNKVLEKEYEEVLSPWG